MLPDRPPHLDNFDGRNACKGNGRLVGLALYHRRHTVLFEKRRACCLGRPSPYVYFRSQNDSSQSSDDSEVVSE